MKQRLNHYWRIFATGLCFVVFGLCGLLLSTVALPLLALRQRHLERRREQAQWLVHKAFAFFIHFMETVGIVRLDLHGMDKLRNSRGELVVANHPTLVDALVLMAHMPRADCIVKRSLADNLFMRGGIRATDYILNDGSAKLIDSCVARIQQGHSIVIFPEGTRTAKNAVLNTFLRGAANIAARTGAPLRPVIIHCTPSTLTKNEKWYQVPVRRFVLSVNVLDCLYVNDIIAESPSHSIAARRINSLLYTFFELEVSRHDRAGTGAEGTDHPQSGVGRYPGR